MTNICIICKNEIQEGEPTMTRYADKFNINTGKLEAHSIEGLLHKSCSGKP